MPVASNDLLLDEHSMVKPGRQETPEMPATERALQSITEIENQLGVIPRLFVETVSQQPQPFRNELPYQISSTGHQLTTPLHRSQTLIDIYRLHHGVLNRKMVLHSLQRLCGHLMPQGRVGG